MLQAGIVGLPNVGKSTLFNAVTRSHKAAAENFPFCTIDPNVGVVTVPDERVEVVGRLAHSKKVVPTHIQFVDIAGLVKGASQGLGLGNQFLGHIREVEAVVQVVRCFPDPDVIHEMHSVDPLRDIEVVTAELILADLAAMEKRRDSRDKKAKTGDKEAKREVALMDRVIPHLDQGKPALTLPMAEEERELLASFFLLSAKPVLFACNVGESDFAAAQQKPDEHPLVSQVHQYAAEHHGAKAVVVSARIEQELIDLEPGEAAAFLADMGVARSGSSCLIEAVYELLGLRTFLTGNDKEARAWTIRAGATAQEAAGAIHTDFQRGFIAAEVVHFEDLARLGGTAKAREAGKLRIEGRDYEVKDGDVIEFRFHV